MHGMLNRREIFGTIAFLIVLSVGCISAPQYDRANQGDIMFFNEAQKALDARDYEDAIEKFSLFLDRFPKSPKYSWALQRLGESFEGLLDVAWRRRIERGEARERVTQDFLNRYGRYGVWTEHNGTLHYDKRHYRMVIEKFPDSPIADEAQYRLITLSDETLPNPAAIEEDIRSLEAVIEHYPTTSLRPEIFYTIARRCRLLYEIYAFSPPPQPRDSDKAQHYRTKAVYAYKLCLQSPEHSLFAQKAWEELRDIEEGRRAFVLQ
ncbi:MAG: hypothetical protein N3B18_04000 [Desulfobacterota bacterium]|nr:hypothetical protein [Thermodesulfobacteriota bacterium]